WRPTCARTGTSSSTTPAPSAAATAARTRSGTPFCVTVDFDTLDDNAVTVRERDTMKQERVSLDQIQAYLGARLLGC
ncbi:Anticodon binding domain-containing protein, partial [Streptomyces sp. Ncost-T6T-2b]